jgi:hypothetical protein
VTYILKNVLWDFEVQHVARYGCDKIEYLMWLRSYLISNMYTIHVMGLPYVSIHHSEIEHFPLINHKKKEHVREEGG